VSYRTSAGTPRNGPSLSGGELQRQGTPKQPGLNPSGGPKLDGWKFAVLMEGIATLERELQKARSGKG